MPKMIYPI